MRTPLSSGLAAASLGLLVAGLAFRSWQVVLLALPPVIVLALGSLFPPARPRLLAIRTLSRDRAEAGRGVDVKLVVRNDGPTLDLVEIVDVLPREFEIIHGTNHAVVSLERGGTMPLTYTVRSPVKGDFRIGPVRVRSLDPLALGAEDAVLPTDARLVVAPTMEDLRRTKLQPRRTRPWFGQVSSRQPGEGTDFWEVRDWVPPAFGRKQLYRILDHLTRVRPGGEWPFAHVAWVLTRFFPRDCLIVLISPLQDRAALNAVIAMEARGYDVAIVSPSPLAIEWRLGEQRPEDQTALRILRMERDNLVSQLRRVAQVVDWDPATPLALALRRIGTWPRPS